MIKRPPSPHQTYHPFRSRGGSCLRGKLESHISICLFASIWTANVLLPHLFCQQGNRMFEMCLSMYTYMAETARGGHLYISWHESASFFFNTMGPPLERQAEANVRSPAGCGSVHPPESRKSKENRFLDLLPSPTKGNIKQGNQFSTIPVTTICHLQSGNLKSHYAVKARIVSCLRKR